jgi:hypothetical protein
MTKSGKFLKKLKRGKSPNPNKMIIKKSIFKITGLLMIIGLSWTGLLAVGNTVSSFNDTENSAENNLSAGTLDFHLNPSADFVSSPLGKGDTASYLTALVKDGNLGFQYTAATTDMAGDSDLCNYLTLEADLNGGPVYNGPLSGFSVPAENYADPSVWNFIVTLPIGADDSFQDKTCNFKFTFAGWQENLLSTQGFNNTEQINATISSDNWTVSPPLAPDIVINEFLPNPVGADNAPMPGGEWVELYNRGTTVGDVNNWALYDNYDSHELAITPGNTNTGGTTIAPGGFLVVYRNGDADFSLNNTGGDTVRLYNGEIGGGGILIDSHAYTMDAAVNKSFARIPDGSDSWVDPIPTPGSPNKMEEATNEVLNLSNPSDNPQIETENELEIPIVPVVPDQVSGGDTAVIDVIEPPIVEADPAPEIIIPEEPGPVAATPEPEQQTTSEPAIVTESDPITEIVPVPAPEQAPVVAAPAEPTAEASVSDAPVNQ